MNPAKPPELQPWGNVARLGSDLPKFPCTRPQVELGLARVWGNKNHAKHGNRGGRRSSRGLRWASARARCRRAADCTAILAEVQANNEKVKQLASDKGLKTDQNVAADVAGFVVPVLWFGMDFQGTADTEITALQNRQQYLATMADQKRCGAEPEPPPASSAKRAKPKPVAAAPAAQPAE